MIKLVDRPYQWHSEAELLELRPDLEKFQQKKIQEKLNAADDEDYERFSAHIVQLDGTLGQIETELTVRREERQSSVGATNASVTPQPTVPPGWYVDHLFPNQPRWWNGAHWTGYVHPTAGR